MAINKNLAPGVKAAGANCKNIADPVARKRCEDAAKARDAKAARPWGPKPGPKTPPIVD